MKTLVSAGALTALLVAVPAHAQDKTAEIDKIFAWTKPDAPGCAVAVSHQGKQVVNRPYGLADLERNVALTPDTVFDALAGLFFNERTGEPLRLAVDRGRFRVAGGPGLLPLDKNRYRRWGATAQFMSEDKFELNFLSPDQLELKSMEGTATPYRRAQPFTPTDADLKAFAGRYDSRELKAVIEFTHAKGGLMGRINEGPADGHEFKPVDRDTFQLGMLTIRFRRDPAGKILGLDFTNPVLRTVKFTRLSDVTSGR